MMPNKDERAKMSRAARDILLESTDAEFCEALSNEGVDFDLLAAGGLEATQRALAQSDDDSTVRNLHCGLSALLILLRRRSQVSIDVVAAQANVDEDELRRIESGALFEPNPRTIYQLEKHFKLPERTLAVLSGAVRVDRRVGVESVRFAASSMNIGALSQEERRLMNRFVKFLREYTDK
jgi:hypothetical protein